MMSCASGNSRRLSIKFMCVTLPYMSIVGRIQENLGTEWSSPYSLSRFAPHLCQSIAREQRADEKNSGMARTQ